jgi:hypothetical protein
MQKTLPTLAVLTTVVVTMAALTQAADDPKQPDADDVFRAPFTLKLHVDKQHYYEQQIAKTPYVHQDAVFLFKDEEFGLAFDIQNKSIRSVKYQKDLKKADVTLKFTELILADGTGTMMLKIQNNTKHTLNFDALMTVPSEKKPMRTSILPVHAGLSHYETWPHPILQLVLHNIRIAPPPAKGDAI